MPISEEGVEGWDREEGVEGTVEVDGGETELAGETKGLVHVGRREEGKEQGERGVEGRETSRARRRPLLMW